MTTLTALTPLTVTRALRDAGVDDSDNVAVFFACDAHKRGLARYIARAMGTTRVVERVPAGDVVRCDACTKRFRSAEAVQEHARNVFRTIRAVDRFERNEERAQWAAEMSAAIEAAM